MLLSFENYSIIAVFGLLAFFTYFHIGLLVIMLPTMFLYIYKRYIVNIFFHLGATGLTYVWIFEDFIEKNFVGYGTMGHIINILAVATSISFIPHLLFCIYATIFNYRYFKSLNIKNKFSLCFKSFFAGLALAFVCVCITKVIEAMGIVEINNDAIQLMKILEFTLTILANILLFIYIIYKDIKAYLVKKKER
ncbi:hypothetical protein [Helicobacter sp. T3_23-1056]